MPKVKYPQLQDPEWVREQYITRNQTMYDIAALLGCNAGSVYYALKRHGIQARANTQLVAEFKSKLCRSCGEEFQPSARCHLYCEKCKVPPSVAGKHTRAKLRKKCSLCGKFFQVRVKRWTYYSAEFCSSEHRAAFLEKHEGKAARRRVNDGGYVEIRVGKGVPGAWSNGYRSEHALVMEQRIGRRLYPNEEVHHRNGIKDDNDRFCSICEDVELPQELVAGMLQCSSCGGRTKPNLELWTTSQPRGQRVEDKIAWAQEFLAQYGYEVPASPIP